MFDGQPTGFGRCTLGSGNTYIGYWLNGMPYGLVTLTFTEGQQWVGEMRANKYFGKRTTYYANGKIINALDETTRYKSIKEITNNKELVFYSPGSLGPEPHKALAENWKDFVKKEKKDYDDLFVKYETWLE